MINEAQVEKYLRRHLIKKGWSETNDPRKIGQHGWDISAFHPKWRKILLVECKGDSKNNNSQKIHNAFYTSIGQVMARMDKQGNNPKRARIYAISIPATWFSIFKQKVKKMEYGWNLMKLKIFLVYNNGKVYEKTYRDFLRNF